MLSTAFKSQGWLLAGAIIFFIIVAIAGGLALSYEFRYQNKIYSGVHIGDLDLSGKTYDEAKSLLNEKINKIYQEGITFHANNHSVNIYPAISSVESDLAYEIISLNAAKTAEQAINLGRDKNLIENWKVKMNSIMFNHQISLQANVNEEKVVKFLQENFIRYESPAKNAELVIKKIGANIEFDVTAEQSGKTINYKAGVAQLKHNLLSLNTEPIYLETSPDDPEIYKNEILNVNSKAQELLTIAPLILKYNDNTWEIKKEQIAEWLSLKINPFYQENSQDKILVGFSNEKLEAYLAAIIAGEINQEPVNAKFKIEDGKVTEFQASADGRELNIAANIAKIEYEFAGKKQNEIGLIVKEVKSPVSTADINDLGIKEIIGTGWSSFAGSPTNRRHNIAVGASSLHGVLLKPGEEFSLLKVLGEINAETGYLPELVIKDNRTIPEYGGGLCQIGTTTFRTVLEAGLPVTMRRNHSYRVSYYEPAGTDATIYDPWPDFKFLNDTQNHLLIQTRIEGDNIYFDFWGTKDGRKVEKTDPVIYNIVKPAPTKLVETTELAPGKKKCTESAHNGADAYFDYKVIYADGIINEERFTSHYVPWREVCLIGVEKLSSEKTETTETENSVAN